MRRLSSKFVKSYKAINKKIKALSGVELQASLFDLKVSNLNDIETDYLNPDNTNEKFKDIKYNKIFTDNNVKILEQKDVVESDKLQRKFDIGWKIYNTTSIISNDSIKNITDTNVAYVMPHIIVIKNNKYLMFDECDDVYINTFKSKISFKDLEGKSHKKITNIYNKENILGKTWRDLIRIIPIKDNDKFKSNKLELGVITINLSNIRSTDGTQLYKNIFKTSKVPT